MQKLVTPRRLTTPGIIHELNYCYNISVLPKAIRKFSKSNNYHTSTTCELIFLMHLIAYKLSCLAKSKTNDTKLKYSTVASAEALKPSIFINTINLQSIFQNLNKCKEFYIFSAVTAEIKRLWLFTEIFLRKCPTSTSTLLRYF